MEKGLTFLELKTIESALESYIDAEKGIADYYSNADDDNDYNAEQGIKHRNNLSYARTALAKIRGAVML